MTFHPQKCKVLSVTLENRQHIFPFDRFPYCLGDVCLDYVDCEKDLGVLVSSKLNWMEQSNALAKKAKGILALLKRSCHFVDSIPQKRLLYMSLVKSQFEHCCVIWRPHNEGVLKKLEKVQEKAIKWILSEQYVDYSESDYLERQYMLDLLPMNIKFTLSDLNIFHRIIHKNICISLPSYLDLFSIQSNRLRSTHMDPLSFVSKIQPRVVRRVCNDNDDQYNYLFQFDYLKQFEKSYFYRVHLEWNNLPLSLRIIENHDLFLTNLKKYLWALLMEKPD